MLLPFSLSAQCNAEKELKQTILETEQSFYGDTAVIMNVQYYTFVCAAYTKNAYAHHVLKEKRVGGANIPELSARIKSLSDSLYNLSPSDSVGRYDLEEQLGSVVKRLSKASELETYLNSNDTQIYRYEVSCSMSFTLEASNKTWQQEKYREGVLVFDAAFKRTCTFYAECIWGERFEKMIVNW